MSKKSLGERNSDGFTHRYAHYAEDKAHNAHYERPNTLALLPDDKMPILSLQQTQQVRALETRIDHNPNLTTS